MSGGNERVGDENEDEPWGRQDEGDMKEGVCVCVRC